MKKVIASLVLAIISVLCFVGCTNPLKTNKIDIDKIRDEVRKEVEEDNKKAEADKESKEKEEEEKIREQVKKELEEQKNKNTEEKVTVNVTDDSKPDPVVIIHDLTPTTTYYNSEFIFPQSSTEYLTTGQVSNLTDYQLGIARNEIYARHGYIFKLDMYKSYFESQSWYVPRYYDAESISLNEIETYNVELIKEEEANRGIEW